MELRIIIAMEIYRVRDQKHKRNATVIVEIIVINKDININTSGHKF